MRIERGAGLPRLEKLPYFPEQAQQRLAGCDTLVLAGARTRLVLRLSRASRAVSLRTVRSWCSPRPTRTPPPALGDLADALGAPARAPAPADSSCRRFRAARSPRPRSAPRSRGYSPRARSWSTKARPAASSYFLAAEAAPPHSYLALTGGAIGQGLPCATGAALACPQRKVISLQADGSGFYTLAGALDPGTRAARRRDTDLCKPQLSHPAARAGARRQRRARPAGALAHGPLESSARLDRPRARLRRSRHPCPDRRRAHPRPRRRPLLPRPTLIEAIL